MKVLIVTGAYPSNPCPSNAIFVHKQAVELKNNGVDVAVMEVDLRSVRHIRRMGLVKDNYENVTVYRFSLPLGRAAMRARSLCRKVSLYGIKKVMSDYGKPDIVHVHLMESANDFTSMLNSLNGIGKVITEHWPLWITEVKDTRRLEAKLMYEAADAIISVSTRQRDYILDKFGINTTVIPNFINNQFKPQKSMHDHFVFISVGDFRYGKRFDLTIKAFSKFHANHLDSELILVGKGELFNDMTKLATELGIAQYITFCGEVNNSRMCLMYNRADVFILPSMRESFGIVYAEAAACGLPVIATDCGGPTDIVTDTNGVMVPVGDIDELINAMEFVYKNYEQYSPKLMSNEIFSKFGKDAVISKIMALYEELVDGE